MTNPSSTRAAAGRAGPAGRAGAASALAALAVVTIAALAASLALGVRDLPAAAVWDALAGATADETTQRIVLDLRLPRTVVGALAGAALGLAGVLVQGVTRNPLADPGLLGINAGAALAVVLSISVLGVGTPTGFVWFAFVGAAAAVVGVAAIGRDDPVRLALGGAALTALLTPITTIVLLRDGAAFEEYRFWVVGSLAGRGLEVASALWPVVAVATPVALMCARRLDLLALGDDVARSLGQRVGVTRGLCGVAVALLAGAAVSLAGPIALVGLVVPHAARRLVGPHHLRMALVALLMGPVLVLVADVAGRLVARPGEVDAGVVAAFVGAPVLVAVARSRQLVAS